MLCCDLGGGWPLCATIQNSLRTLSVRYARRLNLLKCAYFNRQQTAGILIKGLLSKIAKLIILKKSCFQCFEQKNVWKGKGREESEEEG